ncbi:MAG: cupin domain-containing protein [Acetobacteraceae bacterium]|nr:cupin domain-containing protein [Acetobacteraceae bacterium]
MFPVIRSFRNTCAFAGLLVASLALTAPAHAGSCPADQLRPDGSGEKMNTTPAKDVMDSVLASIDLANEPAAIKDRLLRLRRLEIQPGGVVPWHSHGNRPAIIYMIQGEIVEYSSTCAVPVVHHTGDVAVETHATAHWWKNLGQETAVLLSADLFPAAASDHHMM